MENLHTFLDHKSSKSIACACTYLSATFMKQLFKKTSSSLTVYWGISKTPKQYVNSGRQNDFTRCNGTMSLTYSYFAKTADDNKPLWHTTSIHTKRVTAYSGGFRGAKGAEASPSKQGAVATSAAYSRARMLCDRLCPPFNQPPPFKNPGSATGCLHSPNEQQRSICYTNS